MSKLSTNDEATLEKIGRDLKERMSAYTHPLHPTNNEVTIA